MTKRLLFVPLNESHIDDLTSLQNDLEVIRYLKDGVYLEYENGAQGLIQRSIDEHRSHAGLGFWHVSSRSDGRFMGMFNLHNVQSFDQIAVGMIFSRDAWGKWVIADFAETLFEYVFHGLGRSLLIATTAAENRSTRFWLEVCGFQFKANVLVGNDRIPNLLYVIHRSTWERLLAIPRQRRYRPRKS